MKTISRLSRRYIMAAFGIVLLVFAANAALFLTVIVYFGNEQHQTGYLPIGSFAASFTQAEDGSCRPDPDLDWQARFEWAMLLDDQGDILWSEALPQELDHSYTVPEVASFTRWYLNDYPVIVYRNDYGLLVAGWPKDSVTRFDFYMQNDILRAFLSGFPLLLDVAIILLACLFLGWRAARPLRDLARGIELLAEGEPVGLAEAGATAELAEKLNQTSRRLQEQARLLQRRDAARTNWIAGVSHDIRTPLALIMGYAEQLERAPGLDPEGRRKAAAICMQSQKIKTLIDDLNLTSKLQYNAQPLRLREIQVGPMLRRCAADFCDTLDDRCAVTLSVSEEAGRLTLRLDAELMARAVDNLLNNSVRHNPDGCEIAIRGELVQGELELTVRDNGVGYPERVLKELCRPEREKDPDAPHILGLYLVRQIIEAHGGRVRFFNDHGAAAVISLNA